MSKRTNAEIFRAGVLAERRRVLTIVKSVALEEDVQTKIEGIFDDKTIDEMFNSYMRNEIPFRLS
jgi:hypothetical protein